MSGHLVHFAAPLADRTPCGADPDETPHVRRAKALLSRAAHACPACLAHVRDPEPAEHIARLKAYLGDIGGALAAAIRRRDEAAEHIVALTAEMETVTADLEALRAKEVTP